jgi:molybdenum cofactor cytidylyltransferase
MSADMSRAPSLCAVILAAGESSRMGRDKALLPWPPVAPGLTATETFLSAAIRGLSPYNEMVFVVAGKNKAVLTPIVYASSAYLVTNPDPERGQFSSLRIGLNEVLGRGRDAAMITLVDRPPVGNATIEKLRNAFFEAVQRGKWAVVPAYNGKHGHPVVAGREMMEAFLRADSASTARDVEHQHRDKIEYVELDDPLVSVNVNTPEDYAALLALVAGSLK